jgi:hypothetical protein
MDYYYQELVDISNVVIETLTLLLHVREVLGSNLGSQTGYPYRPFSCFFQSPQEMPG